MIFKYRMTKLLAGLSFASLAFISAGYAEEAQQPTAVPNSQTTTPPNGGTANAGIVKASTPKATASSATSLEVYENNSDLVLVEPEGPRKLVAPKKLQSNGRYIIRMKKDAAMPVVEDKAKEPTQEELISARKYLFDANEAFFKGDLQRAWALIDEAEKLDPENYRIKSMKGSLLYRTGSKDLAIPLWEQSLATNPDQPEIRKILEKSKEELKL